LSDSHRQSLLKTIRDLVKWQCEVPYQFISIHFSLKPHIYIPCVKLPSIVAFTVDRIFSCVPIVGILSDTWNRFVRIRLSVQLLASNLATLVISIDSSASCFAVAINCFFVPISPPTSSLSCAIKWVIRLATSKMSLSVQHHWFIFTCKSCAAI